MNKGFQLNALDPNSLGDLKRLARSGRLGRRLRAAAKQFEGPLPADGHEVDARDHRAERHDGQRADTLVAGHARPADGAGDVAVRRYRAVRRYLPPARRQGCSVRPDAAGEAGKTGFDLADVRRRPAIPAVLARDAESAAAPRLAALPAGRACRRWAPPRPQGSFPRCRLYERAARRPASTPRCARVRAVSKSAQDFVTEVWPHAQEASRRTGIPPNSWSPRRRSRPAGDRSSCVTRTAARAQPLQHQGRQCVVGRTVAREVTEYADGQAYTEAAHFRSYGSYAESFRDYAQADDAQPALRRRAQPDRRGGLRARPAGRRLRHRPDVRRQAHPHHRRQYLCAVRWQWRAEDRRSRCVSSAGKDLRAEARTSASGETSWRPCSISD